MSTRCSEDFVAFVSRSPKTCPTSAFTSLAVRNPVKAVSFQAGSQGEPVYRSHSDGAGTIPPGAWDGLLGLTRSPRPSARGRLYTHERRLFPAKMRILPPPFGWRAA